MRKRIPSLPIPQRNRGLPLGPKEVDTIVSFADLNVATQFEIAGIGRDIESHIGLEFGRDLNRDSEVIQQLFGVGLGAFVMTEIVVLEVGERVLLSPPERDVMSKGRTVLADPVGDGADRFDRLVLAQSPWSETLVVVDGELLRTTGR